MGGRETEREGDEEKGGGGGLNIPNEALTSKVLISGILKPI